MITRLHLYSKWSKVCDVTCVIGAIWFSTWGCAQSSVPWVQVSPMLWGSHQGYHKIKYFEEMIRTQSNICRWMSTQAIVLSGLPLLGSPVKIFCQEDVCGGFQAIGWIVRTTRAWPHFYIIKDWGCQAYPIIMDHIIPQLRVPFDWNYTTFMVQLAYYPQNL